MHGLARRRFGAAGIAAQDQQRPQRRFHLQQPLIAQRVASYEVMMTLVSAGLALGLAGAAHIASGRGPGVVARRLAGKPQMLATYLLHRDVEPSEMLARFIERVASIDSADGSSAAEDS